MNASFGDLGDTACALAHAGAAVFPCNPRAKTPLGAAAPHGVLDATTNVDVVDEWWRRWPTANIGMRIPEGVVALDIDPRNGGHETWTRLQAEHQPAPPTRTQRTGSGGLHILFGATGPFRGSLGPGIDLKSSRGYVIVQPSVHPDGGTYEWINSGEIAPAPSWLRGLVLKPTATPRQYASPASLSERAEGVLRTVANATEGQRNALCYWGCRRALEIGFDVNEVIEAAVSTGLPRVEAERTAASAAAAEAA